MPSNTLPLAGVQPPMTDTDAKTHPLRVDGHDDWIIKETTDPFTEWSLVDKEGRTRVLLDACGYVELPRGPVDVRLLVELLQRADALDDVPGAGPWWAEPEDDGNDEE